MDMYNKGEMKSARFVISMDDHGYSERGGYWPFDPGQFGDTHGRRQLDNMMTFTMFRPRNVIRFFVHSNDGLEFHEENPDLLIGTYMFGDLTKMVNAYDKKEAIGLIRGDFEKCWNSEKKFEIDMGPVRNAISNDYEYARENLLNILKIIIATWPKWKANKARKLFPKPLNLYRQFDGRYGAFKYFIAGIPEGFPDFFFKFRKLDRTLETRVVDHNRRVPAIDGEPEMFGFIPSGISAEDWLKQQESE